MWVELKLTLNDRTEDKQVKPTKKRGEEKLLQTPVINQQNSRRRKVLK